ncbi:WD40-repeat-containing domain protein [Xylariaceae sp. FL0255]|nr:WD40-repeat-containing domain protein [Xylariaceae sp. FL0255]
MSSSPPIDPARLLSPPRQRSGKERKDPSITPRKFKRFFTPRNQPPSQLSPARKALRELGSAVINRGYQTPAPSSPLKPLVEEDTPGSHESAIFQSTRQAKRRKFHHTPESSPIRLPSLSLKPSLLSPVEANDVICELDDEDSGDDFPISSSPPKQISSLTTRGIAGQLAQRELGGLPRAGHAYMSYPADDWRIDTADFCSRPEDIHTCMSHETPGHCIPFCAASCHQNGIVAVGDEEGRVRLLDSSSNSSEPFGKIHLSFVAHSNAIIDLDFSNDDYLLATASGDQTGQVIDMKTQTPVAYLRQHTASLKQIQFQPGQANNSVLATSSRDGSVQIWDLRCSRPAINTGASAPKEGHAVNSLYHAHALKSRQLKMHTSAQTDTPSRRETPSRSSDISVTALQFLPAGQEHLLLTACEADAVIKLWDIRSFHSSRHKVPAPLSTTAQPSSHVNWRTFGISSLSLGTDASRLYALCKDNTVYAYSTAHLILGHAPELSTRTGEPPRRRHNNVIQQGLGPLYGFRHPSFQATSFYVKCAVRPAQNGHSELLAVGSSDSCAVLFPTQERQLEHHLSESMSKMSLETSTFGTDTTCSKTNMKATTAVRRPLFSRTNSASNLSAPRLNEDIPIIRAATPLVRGHNREVGSIAWTNESKLVTISDDYLIRCWGKDREAAADLRSKGETGGRRWKCGWAHIGDDYDRLDDDED